MAIRSRPFGRRTTRQSRREENEEDIQRQYLWNTPNGKRPDFSETYTYGNEILISWNALNNSVYDLWLTSWEIDPDPVALCLARAVNLAHDGNLKLVTSNPPTAQLANETRYVLRFKPPTSQGAFVASDPDLTSPGFLLVESTTISTNSVPSNGTTGTASATARVSPSPTRGWREVGTSTAAPNRDEPSHNNMSPGAAAGLAIGLILAVALLVAMEVAYLMWRRKRRRRRGEAGGEKAAMNSRSSLSFWSSRRRTKRVGKGGARGDFVEVDKAEMVIGDSVWIMSPELPGDSIWGQRLVHELQGSRLGRTLTINSSLVELEAGRG